MAKNPRARHSKTKREPVTIDLEADAVDRDAGGARPGEEEGSAAEPEQSAAEPGRTEEEAAAAVPDDAPAEPEQTGGGNGDGGATPPEERPEPARPRGGAGRAFFAGIVGGIVVLAIAGGLQWANLLPAPGAPRAALDALHGDVSTLRDELSQMRQQVAAAPSEEAVNEALAEPRQAIVELRDAVSALQEAVSAGGAGENAGLETLDRRLSALESRAEQLAPPADGEAFAERLAGLESTVEEVRGAAAAAQEQASAAARRLDELAEEVQRQDEGPRLALVVAASALRSAVERGDPFASELETYTALAPDTPELDALQPYAETGIPTHAALAAEAPEVASRIATAATAPPPGAGFLDRLTASARSAVTVRPVGEVEGETAEAIAARMEAAVEAGDYARALGEYEALPAEAKEIAAPFAERLRARQAADEILEEALSQALQPA